MDALVALGLSPSSVSSALPVLAAADHEALAARLTAAGPAVAACVAPSLLQMHSFEAPVYSGLAPISRDPRTLRRIRDAIWARVTELYPPSVRAAAASQVASAPVALRPLPAVSASVPVALASLAPSPSAPL